MSVSSDPARSFVDVTAGTVVAQIEIAAPPERVFAALTEEVPQWWGSAQTYQTESWTGDVRVGGKWRAEGRSSSGGRFAVYGEFLRVDPPRELVQTWSYDWGKANETTITYVLKPIDGGTHLSIRQTGFTDADDCRGHGEGWKAVLSWLRGHAERAS